LNRREKAYIIAVVFLAILLIIKSLYIDGYVPKNDEEKIFYDYVNMLIDENKKGDFLKHKIVKIIKDEGQSTIEVYDEGSKQLKEISLEGKYKARVRKYILGIIPYGEYTIIIENKGGN